MPAAYVGAERDALRLAGRVEDRQLGGEPVAGHVRVDVGVGYVDLRIAQQEDVLPDARNVVAPERAADVGSFPVFSGFVEQRCAGDPHRDFDLLSGTCVVRDVGGEGQEEIEILAYEVAVGEYARISGDRFEVQDYAAAVPAGGYPHLLLQPCGLHVLPSLRVTGIGDEVAASAAGEAVDVPRRGNLALHGVPYGGRRVGLRLELFGRHAFGLDGHELPAAVQADFVPAGTFGSRNETLLGRKRPVEPGLRLRGIFRAVQTAQQQQ